MSRQLSRSLVDNLNFGLSPGYLGVRLSESLLIQGRRSVTGHVDGAYLSATVEAKGPQSYDVRGWLRGQTIDFRVAIRNGYLDLSPSVPHLDHATARAIWKMLSTELGLPFK